MKNRKKESFFSFFFTHPLIYFSLVFVICFAIYQEKKNSITAPLPLRRGEVDSVEPLRQVSCGVTKSFIEDFVAVGYRVAFQSEEIRAALFFPGFKYQLLSLCKSPNLHITGFNYYTVTASPRWGSYGATKAIIEDFVAVYFAQSSRRKKSGMHCFYHDLSINLCHSVRVPVYT